MPPRRPGGKYKGLVGRSKTEAELAQEAMARAKAEQDAVVAKAAARKQKELIGKSGLENKDDPEEMRKQKILSMMMGGKKGNTAKFFKAWVVGTAMTRKERKIAEREKAWRCCCGTHDPKMPGGCSACARLGDSVLDFALDSFLNTDNSKTFRDTMWRTYQGTLRDIPLSDKASAQMRGSASGFLPTIRSEPLRIPDWIHGDVENVRHYKNGRKYLMDTSSMKIRAQPSKELVISPSANSIM